jgi:uncharacterized Zn finger protein
MAFYDYGGWPPYTSIAERRANAQREIAKLRKKGQALAPIKIEGRKISTTFWGKAWCDNLENYRDVYYRLERGRSYVRNGLVIDLHIAERKVSAMVCGSKLYRVTINVDPVAAPQWTAIRKDCAGGIDSLVELLQGRLSQNVMERMCRQGQGLFPKPDEIHFQCSCPDFALMCKHVSAVLYGVGARLDAQPDLLFRLRSVDEKELITGLDEALPTAKRSRVGKRVLEADDLSAMFGLDMAAPEPVVTTPVKTRTKLAKKPEPSQRAGSDKRPTGRTMRRRALAEAAE